MQIRRIAALFALLLLGFATGCPNTAPTVLDAANDEEVVSPSADAQKIVEGLALPPGANTVVSVETVTAYTPNAARRAGDIVDAEVIIDSAMLVIRDITLHQVIDHDDDDPNDMSDDPNDMDDDPNDMSDDPNDMDDDPNDGNARGRGRDDHPGAVKLVGPFLVDLVNETTENLGLSNIDDDADDDGIKDADDDDDDNDGVPDDIDDDDDGDGIPDHRDQVMGRCKIFDAMSLPPGVYRHLKFKMHRLNAERFGLVEHPMEGLSAWVTGTIDGVPFEFRHRFNESFKFSSRVGIEVVDGEISTFLLTIDVASWFAAVDVTTAELQDDGSILIDARLSNQRLANMIRHLIGPGCRMGPHDGRGSDRRGGRDDDEPDDDEDDSEDDDDGDDDDGADDDHSGRGGGSGSSGRGGRG